jgi:hypothetical protein
VRLIASLEVEWLTREGNLSLAALHVDQRVKGSSMLSATWLKRLLGEVEKTFLDI